MWRGFGQKDKKKFFCHTNTVTIKRKQRMRKFLYLVIVLLLEVMLGYRASLRPTLAMITLYNNTIIEGRIC